MATDATKKSKSTAEMLLEAVQDLHAREQIVTRETLAELTGFTLTVIDDRLGYLNDNGKIRRVQRGVYVPVESHQPARMITRTILPDGTTVLEVGETVLQLSPRESRNLGELMAGSGQQYASIELGHAADAIASELASKIRMLERGLDALLTQQVQQP